MKKPRAGWLRGLLGIKFKTEAALRAVDTNLVEFS
jgi:hypothetical protein